MVPSPGASEKRSEISEQSELWPFWERGTTDDLHEQKKEKPSAGVTPGRRLEVFS
jgi:hypothetical protein